MSKVRADRYTNRADDGAPTFSQGVNVVGSGVSIGIGASVYSPANNQLVLGTNDSERIRILSDGKVGINSTSPGDRLSVSGGNIGIYNTGNNHGNLYFYKDSVSTAWFKYRGDNNAVIIGTNGGDKVTVESGGNLKINDGNLEVGTSGKGIDFSATSDGSGTATSEVLDDYEEGYFAPTVTMTTSGSITLKAAYTELSYIKIGNLVTIVGQLRIDSVSSPVGNISITNLPFTVRANTDLGRGGTAMYYYDASAGSGNVTKVMPMKVTENSTEFDVLIKDTGGGITPGGNDELAFSFSYVSA